MNNIYYKFRTAFIVSIFIAASQSVFSQSARLSGIVTDSKGLPLQGASVFLKNSGSGTVTDSNGHYELLISAGWHHIVASFVGYAEQDTTVFLKRGTVVEQNFTTAEIYTNCAEVIVICAATDGRPKLSKVFSDEIKLSAIRKADLDLSPSKKKD